MAETDWADPIFMVIVFVLLILLLWFDRRRMDDE